MHRDAEGRGTLRASASRARTQRGAATAESMVVLPVVVAVALGLVWVLALGVAQVRVVDGAREAARVAARGEGGAAAATAARRVAPEGAQVRVRRTDDLVTVHVAVAVAGPGGLFAMLPEVTVASRADAVVEPS